MGGHLDSRDKCRVPNRSRITINGIASQSVISGALTANRVQTQAFEGNQILAAQTMSRRRTCICVAATGPPFRSPISLVSYPFGIEKCPRLNRLVAVFSELHELRNEFRMIARKIVSFADIRGQIVKFPRSILLRSNGFPISVSNRNLAPVFPVQIFVFLLRTTGNLLSEDFRQDRHAINIGWCFGPDEFGQRRQNIGLVEHKIADGPRPDLFWPTD